MKKTTMFLAMLAMIPSFAFAAAAPVIDVQSLMGGLNLLVLFKFVVACVVGAMMAPQFQAILEHAIMPLVPVWLSPLKAFLPSVISFILAKVAAALGIDPVQAYTTAMALSGGAHLINESGFAADKNRPDLPPPPKKADGLPGEPEEDTVVQ